MSDVTFPVGTADALAGWLIDVLTGRSHSPFESPERISLPVQIQQLAFADSELLKRIKPAITIAITEWQLVQGVALLVDLARCAAYVKASAAVPALHNAVITRAAPLVEGLGSSQLKQQFAVVIGAIAGFAPYQPARTALANLLVDLRFRRVFAPQLVTALIRCEPESYSRWINHLLEMDTNGEVETDMVAVTREIVRIAGPEAIVQDLPNVQDHRRFCELLGGYRDSPAWWSSRAGEMVLQVTRPARRFAAVAYDPGNNTQFNDVCEVISARINREGGVGNVISLIRTVA